MAETFAEQVPGLTKSQSRQTPVLGTTISTIGLAVAGRPGMGDPKVGEVSVLSIDDCAIRRGHVYGTLVPDMVTSKPIDLLADALRTPLPTGRRSIPAPRWCAETAHNLAEAVEKAVTRHRTDLCLPEEDADQVGVVPSGID
ncbi:hypothetical protein [Rhodococcus wratislaviensis]|nr:hypothetical protein [Rhodococcus wratislaviensis]